MTSALRIAALMIAVAGLVDPAIARRHRAPLPIEVWLPHADDPTFDEASSTKVSLLALLGEKVAVETSEPPRAAIAIGNAAVGAVDAKPVFAITIDPGATLSAIAVTPGDAVVGQRQRVSVRFRARRMGGRSTAFVLERGPSRLASIEHRWTTNDEQFEPRFDVATPVAGFEVLRVTATTPGGATVSVDVPGVVASRTLRIFVYEPRPSWAVGFVRQALESDPAFDVRAVARTSRGVMTQSPGAPQAILALGHDAAEVDVIVAGGLETLTDKDLGALDRFAAARGGAVVLLPDGRVPGRVLAALGLPGFDEVLLERPVDVRSAGLTFRASELLLPTVGDARLRPVATVTHAGSEKPAVTAMLRGAGLVVVSGALDGWRYRGDERNGFSAFWRGAVADAALQAAPRLAVRVDPPLARPGDRITVRATLRETEWTRTADAIQLPPVAASLVRLDGKAEMVRLWPSAAPGVYEAHTAAPPPGRYTLRVQGPRSTSDALLVADDSARTATPDHSAALAQLARTTGGAVIDQADLPRIADILRGIEAPTLEYRARPMRCGWWILPFAGLLSLEWALHRRVGGR